MSGTTIPPPRWRPSPAWIGGRARGHLARLRKENVSQLLASDWKRVAALLRRYRWRTTHDNRPHAVPVFVLGVQRSGTDMIVNAFKECPEAEVHNEAMESRAFAGFALRDDDVVRSLVEASRHRVVLFKSLLDAHRAVELMTALATPSPGRSIWIYRSMEARVRSLLARWPGNNLRVLGGIAAGHQDEYWEAGGLSDERLELVRSFDYDRMTPASAAALMWFLRNSLFFDLRLHERADVALVSYEAFLAEPERLMRLLCSFAGVSYNGRMTADIAPRAPATSGRLDIDEQIQGLCDELHGRLELELRRRLTQSTLAGLSMPALARA